MNSNFMSSMYYANQQYSVGQPNDMSYNTGYPTNPSIMGGQVMPMNQYNQFSFGNNQSQLPQSGNVNNMISQILNILMMLIPAIAGGAQQQPQMPQYPQYPQQPQYPQYQQQPQFPQYPQYPQYQVQPQPQQNQNGFMTMLLMMFMAKAQVVQKPVGQEGVSADKQARAWGDPHIVGANGQKFEFQEEGTYSLLDDSNTNVNCTTVKWDNGTTVINDVGIMAGDHKVQITAGGTVMLNGQGIELKDGETVNLPNNITITRQGNNYLVNGSEYNMTIENQGRYLNVNANSTEKGVFADGVMPTGILGETFAPDNNKAGLLQDVAAYERNNLFDDGNLQSTSQPAQTQTQANFLNYFMAFAQAA